MPLPKDWREFIESLNLHGVEYLVVGAVALAHHGFPRYTGDLDILVAGSADNAARLEQMLQDFGLGGLGLKASDFVGSYQVIQLGVPPQRIDILTALTGVTFEEAWSTKATAEVDGVIINLIGREALVRNKRATRRPQDLADLAALGEEPESGASG